MTRYYSIRHETGFRYSEPITESVMEVRLQPRSDGPQRCRSFMLTTSPGARVHSFRDFAGNTVHHFNVPRRHAQLKVVSAALVEMREPVALPDGLDADAWAELDRLVTDADAWEALAPSKFARSTELLDALACELAVERRDDPLKLLRDLNAAIYAGFEYVPHSTTVESPIDDALEQRRGVCQDFAHIMTALVRSLAIPCRYVSGYLYHRNEDEDRSAEDATHAWVEALLPGLGWVGFDPTNNLIAADRHIRVAVGRDYADVPPTKGVFRGAATSALSVSVQVTEAAEPRPEEELLPASSWPETPAGRDQEQQQQQ